jgi:titin
MKNGLVVLSLMALMLVGAMAAEAATATLTWTDNATNEMGYEIERKPVACATSGTFAKIGDVGVNAITYADGTVAEGATYCYRVRAWNTVDGTPTGTKQFSGYSNLAGLTINFSTPAGPSQLGVTQAP